MPSPSGKRRGPRFQLSPPLEYSLALGYYVEKRTLKELVKSFAPLTTKKRLTIGGAHKIAKRVRQAGKLTKLGYPPFPEKSVATTGEA